MGSDDLSVNANPTAVFTTRSDAIVHALVMAPQEVFSSNTGASVMKTIALDLPIDSQDLADPQRLSPVEADDVARSPDARKALESQLCLLTLYRTRYLFDQAAIANNNVKAIMGDALVSRTNEVAGLQSVSLLHGALLSELMGESGTAILELKKAHSSATWSEFSFSAAEAAGKLAMSYAMLGDLRKASAWLQQEAVSAGPEALFDPSIRCAGTIASALVAARSLQGDRCAAALLSLDQTSNEDELWPFVAYTRALYALVWGDSCNTLDELDDAWIQPHLLDVADTQGGVASPLVATAKAELLMALGRGNHAKVILDGHPDVHPLLSVARARLALLTGDNDEAIALANLVPTPTATITPSLASSPPKASSSKGRQEPRIAADRVDRDGASLAMRPAAVSGASSAMAPVAWQPGLVTLRALAIAAPCPAASSGKP